MLFRGFKNLLRLGGRKSPLFAEDINKVGELSLRCLRNHLFTDDLDIIL
jgi:hypothetical protein